MPEDLPTEESVKKLGRETASEEKKIKKTTTKFQNHER